MDIGEEDSSNMVLKISRNSLYHLMKQCPDRIIEEKFVFLEKKLRNMTKCPESEYGSITRAIKFFKCHFKKKWAAANNKEERFLRKNEQWLNKTLTFRNWTTPKPGRPTKDFKEVTNRSKRRKTMDLRAQVPTDELTFAAQVSQRAAGNSAASQIIKDITTTPTRASKYRKLIVSAQKDTVKKHTPSEALSIFVEADMTRKQYEVIHAANKNIYPCYSLLKRAKKECYPREESMRVTETCAEIILQDLLDHTSLRLCKYLEEVLLTISEDERRQLELISKWGCDGSQQQQFKQKFQNNTDSDTNIFLSSLVPVRLICNYGGQKKVLWQNPAPSSPRYCRPIRIRFIKETADITKEEIKYIDTAAKCLKETEIPNCNSIVKHTLVFTMIDAKVCNAATDTKSTMKCYICGQTSKDFNNLNRKNPENSDALQFGLSILHARIRFFESLLHLAYKLPKKTWQAKTQELKISVAETKKKIQAAFKEEMGLLVDIPKAGFGNTNDGNTSRRFFSDPETASRITGVDVNLINRFKIILETLSSGHRIDIIKFGNYCEETAKLYVQLYEWHPMTPTVHKILRHGSTVIQHAILPIGQLSEEAAEAKNKHFRQYRQNFTRKFSREICNRDVLNRLLLTSDPFLSSTRPKPPKKRIPFSAETIELLLPEETLDVSEDRQHDTDTDSE